MNVEFYVASVVVCYCYCFIFFHYFFHWFTDRFEIYQNEESEIQLLIRMAKHIKGNDSILYCFII